MEPKEKKVIATNSKAFRDYFFYGTFECGIALKGCEVKSIRSGDVNFKDSFACIREGEIMLYNFYISPYAQASYMNENPDRVRKLLLHKKEVEKLTVAVNQKKMALIPTKIYLNKRGWVKVELALGKGKKLYDKREEIKKRDIERSLKRTIHSRRR